METERIIQLSLTITNPSEYGISADLTGCLTLPNGRYNLPTTVLPKFQQVEGDRDHSTDQGYLISSTPCHVQSKRNGPMQAHATINLNERPELIWVDDNFEEIDDVTAWMPATAV